MLVRIICMSTFCPFLKQCTCYIGSKNNLAKIKARNFFYFSDAPAESTLVHCPLERSGEKFDFRGDLATKMDACEMNNVSYYDDMYEYARQVC